MKICADVLHNVSSMLVDSDTSQCQFWACREPVNMPKTIKFPAKCGVGAVIWFIYLEQAMRNDVHRYCPSSWQCSAAYCNCNKRGSWSVFDNYEVFDHPPSSARTWLPVIFISLLVWDGRRGTTFWHSELQTSVENWLNAQAAGFYDDRIGKLVPCYEKVYVGASTM